MITGDCFRVARWLLRERHCGEMGRLGVRSLRRDCRRSLQVGGKKLADNTDHVLLTLGYPVQDLFPLYFKCTEFRRVSFSTLRQLFIQLGLCRRNSKIYYAEPLVILVTRVDL